MSRKTSVPRLDSIKNTHPLSYAGVATIDNLHFLPENAVGAPAPDLWASLDGKHQQNDEGNKHQDAQDDSYGLQDAQEPELPSRNNIH